MPEQIRFLLDEHVPAAVAVGLKQKSIEVTTVQELGLSGSTDLELLELAREESWVLVTFDSGIFSEGDLSEQPLSFTSRGLRV